MKKFQLVDVFDRRTGKKLNKTERSKVGYYCDYCGKFMDEDAEGVNSVSFTINEESGCEESWYYKKFNKPLEDTFNFWAEQTEYHYCMSEDYDESCSGKMMCKAVKNKENLLSEAMQNARVAVVNKLLDNGVTPEELGFGGVDE
jgi:hypothetical protein